MGTGLKKLDSKKVLITGGGGYLGSKLAQRLLLSGSECYLFDIQFNSISEKLDREFDSIHIRQGDITSGSGIQRLCKEIKPDYVFHMAAAIDRIRDFSLYAKLYEINVKGTVNLMEGLSDVNYSGFYYTSSSEVYGTKNILPFRESDPPLPASPYSLTKLMAENYIQTYSSIYNKPYTIYRIFLFWGEDMPETTFISQLMTAARNGSRFIMTRGEQKRDYLTIDDLTECMVTLTGHSEANSEIVNLCSGESASLNEMAQLVESLHPEGFGVERSLPYRNNEIWEMKGSTSKLSQLIPGFCPMPIVEKIKNSL